MFQGFRVSLLNKSETLLANCRQAPSQSAAVAQKIYFVQMLIQCLKNCYDVWPPWCKGEVSNGKNCPSIFSPFPITGTPCSKGSFASLFTPSANTFITNARRGWELLFSPLPCSVSG